MQQKCAKSHYSPILQFCNSFWVYNNKDLGLLFYVLFFFKHAQLLQNWICDLTVKLWFSFWLKLGIWQIWENMDNKEGVLSPLCQKEMYFQVDWLHWNMAKMRIDMIIICSYKHNEDEIISTIFVFLILELRLHTMTAKDLKWRCLWPLLAQPGTGAVGQGTGHLVLRTRHQGLDTKYLVTSTWWQVLGNKYLVLGTWY